jgi:hypothetical protein
MSNIKLVKKIGENLQALKSGKEFLDLISKLDS